MRYILLTFIMLIAACGGSSTSTNGDACAFTLALLSNGTNVANANTVWDCNDATNITPATQTDDQWALFTDDLNGMIWGLPLGDNYNLTYTTDGCFNINITLTSITDASVYNIVWQYTSDDGTTYYFSQPQTSNFDAFNWACRKTSFSW